MNVLLACGALVDPPSASIVATVIVITPFAVAVLTLLPPCDVPVSVR